MDIPSNPLWYSEATAPLESSSKWFCLDQIYLHGTIEQLAGFDLIVNTTGSEVPQGVYPVIIDVIGKTYACTAHVWISRETTKGLVVLNTDKPALEYAFAKFTDKPDRI